MWKTKTHTFNLLLGQETTTLKDVAVQLDLPIDGEPVSGVINGD